MSIKEIQIPTAFEGLFVPKRYKVFYGGRGGAKSHNIARALLIKAMQQPMRIVCAREIQKSIKDSVHALLSDIIRLYGLDDKYQILESAIRCSNGSQFLFRGLKHNTTDLKSLEGADVVWIEEAENVSSKSWEILIPTVRKDESEIWVSFNVKNITDPTYQRFIVKADDDCYIKKVSWRDNPFFPAVLEKERLKLEHDDPSAYAHVWEGEPDTRRNGAVYAKQLAAARDDSRITRVPYDSGYEVFTAWDLGYADSTSIWWLQWVGRELRWLEYYENSGEQLDHYVKVYKDKAYNYAAAYLPHDGGAGNIRGDSVAKQLAAMGVKNHVLKRESDITPGIELLRQTIAFSVFDSELCKDGIHALDNYGYEYDDDRQVFKSKPRHDWSSHAADAARYAAIAAKLAKSGGVAAKPLMMPRQSGWMGL